MWRCVCEVCAYQWEDRLPPLEDPDSLGVRCPECDASLITAVLVGAA